MTSGAVGTPPHSLPLVTISPKKQRPFSNFGVSEAGWIRGVSVWHLSVSSFRLFTVQPNFFASSTALVDNLWHKFAVSQNFVVSPLGKLDSFNKANWDLKVLSPFIHVWWDRCVICVRVYHHSWKCVTSAIARWQTVNSKKLGWPAGVQTRIRKCKWASTTLGRR